MKKIIISVLIFLNVIFFCSIFLQKATDKKEIKKLEILDNYSKIERIEPNNFEKSLESITASEIENYVKYFSSQDLEGRMSGKKGNVKTAEYIKSKFEEFGLKTMYHKFIIKRMNPGPKNETGDDFTQNVYSWIEGNDPILKNEIVVVGAHMDHIGYGPNMSMRSRKMEIHPGADDNASGTSALLEIAEAFSMIKNEIKRTVVFQSYSGEEMGLLGSRFYCENPVFPQSKPNINNHIFMLNLDMIGYLKKGEHLVSFNESESSKEISNYIENFNQKYYFAKNITGRRASGSDHAPFYNKKVPIAFLHTGLHPYYHTPQDTYEKLNYRGAEQISQYAFELAHKVSNNDNAPKFNEPGFKMMNYDHDHGHPDSPFEK